jgi:hypothetical protein
MPLFDHFHRPLLEVHSWESFHSQWGGCIAADLNKRLPKRFLASGPQRLGPFVSADVAELEVLINRPNPQSNGAIEHTDGNGGVALAVEQSVYTVPDTDLSMPVSFPDEYRVEVRDTFQASRVLAVIELVSPGNKDDVQARETFAGKCLSVLAKGIGLVVVDMVTSRSANLHNVLVKLARRDTRFEMGGSPPTYAAAYRPVHRKKQDVVDLWHWELKVGASLPTVPLALREFGVIGLDLEATYAEACQRSRIPE